MAVGIVGLDKECRLVGHGPTWQSHAPVLGEVM